MVAPSPAREVRDFVASRLTRRSPHFFAGSLRANHIAGRRRSGSLTASPVVASSPPCCLFPTSKQVITLALPYYWTLLHYPYTISVHYETY